MFCKFLYRNFLFLCFISGFIFILNSYFLVGVAYSQGLGVVASYKDWNVYYSDKGGVLCFASSSPLNTFPKNVRRGDIRVFVSNFKTERTFNEFSVQVGYSFDANSSYHKVIVGGSSFPLVVDKERAWLANKDMELNLVKAMRRGSKLVVEGLSTRGTKTRDEYSLIGITAALNRIAQMCK